MTKRYYAFISITTIVLVGIAFAVTGCGLKKGININPAIANQQGEKDNNIAKVEAKMDGLQKGFDEVSAKLTMQASAIAGFNNKIQSQSAGRDITTTNDSELMKYIFKYWYGIFVLIIGFMKWNSYSQAKHFQRQIKRLEAEKKDYKDNFLARGIKDEAELREFRRHHELVTKGGGKNAQETIERVKGLVG